MDPFADWLESAGFRRRSAQLILRGAAHLGEWAAIEQVRIEQFDQRVLNTFADHLATCGCAHSFRGGDHRNMRGAKRFVEHLQSRSIVPFEEPDVRPLPDLVEAFNDWMRRHRGATESTIAVYASIATRRVEIGGIARNANKLWMAQIARNVTDDADGFFKGKRYLIHDCDPLFTQEFLKMLAEVDVESVKLPPGSPNLNAHPGDRCCRPKKEIAVRRRSSTGSL